MNVKQSPTKPSFAHISSEQFQQSKATSKTHLPGQTEETSTSLNFNKSTDLNSDSIEPVGTEYVFEFNTENDDLFDAFEDLCQERQFELIQREDTYTTAIKKKLKGSDENSKWNQKINFAIELFTNCLPFANSHRKNTIGGHRSSSDMPTAIKMTLCTMTKHNKQYKICRLKGLSGSVQEVKFFIEVFKQKIMAFQTQNDSAKHFIYDVEKQQDLNPNCINEYSNPYNLEITTYYTIEKILNDKENYKIGQISYRLLEDFEHTFKNIEESVSLIPEPVSNATKIVNQLLHLFHSAETQKAEPNYKSVKIHQSMKPYMRVALENYIFTKLQPKIKSIYSMKSKSVDELFIEKRQKIFEKFNLYEILEEISLNEKFWAINSKILEQQPKILQVPQNREKTRQIIDLGNFACPELEKISLCNSPREKLKHMEISYTLLKTYYFDRSKHEYELSSMEDIIPVLILVVLLLNLRDIRKQLDIIGDFIQSDPYEMESQKRLWINLSESFNYIVRDWKI